MTYEEEVLNMVLIHIIFRIWNNKMLYNMLIQFGISVYLTVNMKAELRKKYNICFDILDLKSFKRSAPNHGWAYIIFILKDGTTFPALHFHNGGSKALLQQFGKYIHIKRY